MRDLSVLSAVSATINYQFDAPLTYAGPQGTYEGLDQVNIQLPSALALLGAGPITIRLTVNGQPSNLVTLAVQYALPANRLRRAL